MSAVTAMRYFNLFNKKPTVLPEVISLDEFKGEYVAVVVHLRPGTLYTLVAGN